jgi:hypothetical protein
MALPTEYFLEVLKGYLVKLLGLGVFFSFHFLFANKVSSTVCNGDFPFRTFPFYPFPFCPKFRPILPFVISPPSHFALSHMAPFPFRPFAILPLCHFAPLPFRPCAISPLCHFAPVPFRPLPFCPLPFRPFPFRPFPFRPISLST